VDIEAAQARSIEHGLRKDQPIGSHNGSIQFECSKGFEFRIIATQARRGANGYSQCLCCPVNRTWPRLLPAPGGARGLAVDCRNLVSRVMEGVKGRNCEVRAAHEGEPKRVHR